MRRAALQSPENAKKGAKSGDFMKWRKPPHSTPPAGAMPLCKMLNPQYSLYLLAEAIPWQTFDEQFGPPYGFSRHFAEAWRSSPQPSPVRYQAILRVRFFG